MRSSWVAVEAGTVPAHRARELHDAWEAFVADRLGDGREDSVAMRVRQPILDSWQRSREAGVDPCGRCAPPSAVGLDRVRDLRDSHPLAGTAPMILHLLGEAAIVADSLVVLSDADGMILRIDGSAHLRNRAADEMNFVEGALWSEAGAGTNAIGTAVAAGHGVQVFAAEHFTETAQRWTCAAAPVRDPVTGELLGIVDLTGDLASANPHSLAVVSATARAVEEVLRGRQRDREDRLRARYAWRLGSACAGAALITGSGRVLLDPDERWAGCGAIAIPAGGGVLELPSGHTAHAEPVEGDDVFVVRPVRASARGAGPVLHLRMLGDGRPEVRIDDAVVRLRPRHLELLTLLVLHRRPTAERLCAELYGADGHPASVRVEMSRLRRLLPGVIADDAYGVRCEVDADFKRVRALLGRGRVRAAAAEYRGPLLPASLSPGVAHAREELDGWLRQAVVTSGDADALWDWVRTPRGDADLIAWLRLLAHLDYADPRRGLAVARVRVLRAEEDPAAPV